MSEHTNADVWHAPAPPIEPLTFNRILGICVWAFALALFGTVAVLTPELRLLRVGIPVACVVAIISFIWLFARRNPDARARRSAGLGLIICGIFALSKVVAFRGLHFATGSFSISIVLAPKSSGHDCLRFM